MSGLIAISFENPAKASEMPAPLAKGQGEYLITRKDEVVVSRKDDGQAQLRQATNLTATGAEGGSFWSTLISDLIKVGAYADLILLNGNPLEDTDLAINP